MMPMAPSIALSVTSPMSYLERDLSESSRSSETPRDENKEQSNGSTIRRSFSWGKKKSKRAEQKKSTTMETEVHTVRLSNPPSRRADMDLGMETHAVTGDIIVSYVGPYIETVQVGDCILAVNGLRVGEGVDDLEIARAALKEPKDEVELVIERNSLRSEVLRRHAALRGTSLDKLGLTLIEDAEHVVVAEVSGLAAKSRRIALGDRLISINGKRIAGLNDACTTLFSLPEEEMEVELELVYGYLQPKEFDFDPETGSFTAPKVKEGALGVVRRSLSFGKKKRADGSSTPRKSSPAPEVPVEIPPVNTEPTLFRIPKDDNGRIGVTFKAHEVTDELIIGLVGSDMPASQAGLEVGDAVLAINGASILGESGDEDLDFVRQVLVDSSHLDHVELMVQKRLRTEVIEFGQCGIGGPRNVLGLQFYSFPHDWAVRVTGLSGAAAKSGRLALGDRIVSMNGIRVDHAQTLSAHISEAGKTCDYITFEVALGFCQDEGLWYGQGNPSNGHQPPQTGSAPATPEPAATPRKAQVKRSFSFGRKPRF
uniref:PDZ domain-containing protein n=1 Tax=Haptolina brevifila TaxID=156173 RepID=A0A7S2GTQ2_9EUKA|mmetsp:Transcript_4757/g.10083  ORF Transcript_4757/g.10083 Transcript_4757/m.10083 type:complete len:540 (+) Transcript_4757:81-1700(+)